MKPRPLYKWKSFWLGILVLGFLGWAWVRSTTYLDEARFLFQDDGWRLASNSGSLAARRFDGLVNPTAGVRKFEFNSKPASENNRKIPPPFESLPYAASPRLHVWRVAYWFLILLFLVPWSAWLFFHWKREQRKLTT